MRTKEKIIRGHEVKHENKREDYKRTNIQIQNKNDTNVLNHNMDVLDQEKRYNH